MFFLALLSYEMDISFLKWLVILDWDNYSIYDLYALLDNPNAKRLSKWSYVMTDALFLLIDRLL